MVATKSLPWRSALVTGASSGIGAALARRLVAGGVTTVGLARRAGALAELAAELGPRFVPCAQSVDDTDALVATLRRLDDERGGIDLVIANAGVGAAAAHPAYSYEATRAALHTNFCGAAATLTALTERMVARRAGHLVSISSLSSFGALPAALAYASPKAGLNMVCDSLRLDLGPRGVAVTSVYLGFVATEMVAHSTHPLPQLLSVDAAADGILTALPRRPSHVTLPRLLGLGARLLAALPEPLRVALFSRQSWSQP